MSLSSNENCKIMIVSICGRIVQKDPSEVIIKTGGLGYLCNISANTFDKLPELNQEVSLLTYFHVTENNQSLFASGCYEKNDNGITRFGKQLISEMNRVGMVIDMSHSAARSTLDAIELSERPIAITHANPSFWFAAKRNKSNEVLKELAKSEGMLGLSLYPHHLKDTSNCTLESFCEMAAQTVELMGIKHIGIGSDLCLKQPNNVVEWMRNGTWTKTKDYGEGSSSNPHFPKQPNWFEDARGFNNLEKGLKKVGFQETEVNDILGNNWYNFYRGINN